MTQSMTESQLREAVELGDDFLVGATQTVRKSPTPSARAQVAEVMLAFRPPLSSLQQYRDVGRKYTLDGGVITALSKMGVTVVATLEPGDLPALTPGRALDKFGASTATVVRARLLK